MTLLHVTFSSSPAGTLRQLFREQGRSDRVASLDDDFSFGPIAGKFETRVEWVDEVLGIPEWDRWVPAVPQCVELSRSPELTPVAWFSRRCAHTYAGFLWWLSRLGERPCRIIDVTDLIMRGHNGREYRAVSPAMLDKDEMLRIIDSHVPLGPEERVAYRALWRQLLVENAPLRVIDEQLSLASAPITYFDALLMNCATPEWRKISRVVGEAMASDLAHDIRQTNDLVLFPRAYELVERGALEWRGELSDVRKCEVRLPGTAKGSAE